MSVKRESLLKRLTDLKEKILGEIEEDFILTDKALKDISKKKPQKLEDYKAISGLSRDFTERFGSLFLNVINEYEKEVSNEVRVSRNAHKVLNHYKDRLYNLSKSNPNIYINKAYKNRYFDLSNFNISDFLYNDKVKEYKFVLKKEELNSLTTLYRDSNKEYKELGSYNLYIAYPFVIGEYKLKNILVKAPLLFIPVKLNRKKDVLFLLKDESKDIILNRDLLLLTSKLMNTDMDDEMLAVKKLSENTLRDEIINFYIKNGISINGEFNNSFEPFKDSGLEFEKEAKIKNYTLKSYMLLGRFNPYSSMIQKDVDEILKSNKYNELLDGLVSEKNLYDKEVQTLFLEKEGTHLKDDITYINELNDAQENVIKKLEDEKKLVIWGPPGTGKSQTITSIIASSILKGENVLLVSEKKVALDVIYQRLKDARKYALFIDDALDKNTFYERISAFIDPNPPVRTFNNEVFEIEQEINEITEKFNKSLKLLYGNKESNIPVSLLFEKYLKTKDIKEDITPLFVFNLFNQTLKKPSFKDLESITEKFSTDNILKEFVELDYYIKKYPVILKLDFKLSRSAKIIFKNFSLELEEYSKNFSKRGFFGRRKLKNDFLNKNYNKIILLTKNKKTDKKYLKEVLKNSNLNTFINDKINKLESLILKYSNFSVNEKLFLELFHKYDVSLRKYFIDAYYTGYLENFRVKNKENLEIIDEYTTNMNRLNSLIIEKMMVTRESFEFDLYKSALNFSNTRRIMDIKRILENQKKPSPKSFFDTFFPEIMENIKIFMMTPEALSTIVPLKFGIFDLIIFDEASQMYVEKGIPAIYRAKKVVIAGDPKQLRPSSLGIGRFEYQDELYEDKMFLNDVSLDAKSLLDLARYKYKETLLNYHYRSVYEELIAFSNHAFYDSKLIVSPNQKESVKPPIEYIYVKDANFVDRKNYSEALKVLELIKNILVTRKNNESIGVITFNITQRNLIENLIDLELFKKSKYQKLFDNELNRKENGEDQSLFIKNIENVQGDERDIIIFSQTYAKDENNNFKRNFGWLSHEGGENRLNVAVTRAKQKIYYVSSLYPDEFKVDDLKHKGPKLLKQFMRYCYYVSERNYDSAKIVLDELSIDSKKEVETMEISKLKEDIVKRLEKLDYEIKSNIGIGSYKIDIAIYDKTLKKYMLGIILDVKDFSNTNARKDLIHLEKYLKSRNWEIYHIFASNWYMDSNREIRNIREILKKQIIK